MVAQAPSESSLSFLDDGAPSATQCLDYPTEEQGAGRAAASRPPPVEGDGRQALTHRCLLNEDHPHLKRVVLPAVGRIELEIAMLVLRDDLEAVLQRDVDVRR